MSAAGSLHQLSVPELRWAAVYAFVHVGYWLGWVDLAPGLVGLRDGWWRVVNAVGNVHILWLTYRLVGLVRRRSQFYARNRCELNFWFAFLAMSLHAIWIALRPLHPPEESFFQIVVPLMCCVLLDQPSLYLLLQWAVSVPAIVVVKSRAMAADGLGSARVAREAAWMVAAPSLLMLLAHLSQLMPGEELQQQEAASAAAYGAALARRRELFHGLLPWLQQQQAAVAEQLQQLNRQAVALSRAMRQEQQQQQQAQGNGDRLGGSQASKPQQQAWGQHTLQDGRMDRCSMDSSSVLASACSNLAFGAAESAEVASSSCEPGSWDVAATVARQASAAGAGAQQPDVQGSAGGASRSSSLHFDGQSNGCQGGAASSAPQLGSGAPSDSLASFSSVQGAPRDDAGSSWYEDMRGPTSIAGTSATGAAADMAAALPAALRQRRQGLQWRLVALRAAMHAALYVADVEDLIRQRLLAMCRFTQQIDLFAIAFIFTIPFCGYLLVQFYLFVALPSRRGMCLDAPEVALALVGAFLAGRVETGMLGRKLRNAQLVLFDLLPVHIAQALLLQTDHNDASPAAAGSHPTLASQQPPNSSKRRLHGLSGIGVSDPGTPGSTCSCQGPSAPDGGGMPFALRAHSCVSTSQLVLPVSSSRGMQLRSPSSAGALPSVLSLEPGHASSPANSFTMPAAAPPPRTVSHYYRMSSLGLPPQPAAAECAAAAPVAAPPQRAASTRGVLAVPFFPSMPSFSSSMRRVSAMGFSEYASVLGGLASAISDGLGVAPTVSAAGIVPQAHPVPCHASPPPHQPPPTAAQQHPPAPPPHAAGAPAAPPAGSALHPSGGSSSSAFGGGGDGPPSHGHGAQSALYFAEWHESVTVLFLDMVRFTEVCGRVEAPVQVVEMLNDLFSRLDSLCMDMPIYKVMTIGDGYMAATGLFHDDNDHAATMVDFARMALREARHVRIPGTDEPLQLRIGIHSGRVMGGMVGMLRRQYTLFGDTVNTASRMESTGFPGRIQVSEATYHLLQASPEYSWVCRGTIDVKGKGQMVTYLLDMDSEGLPPERSTPERTTPTIASSSCLLADP